MQYIVGTEVQLQSTGDRSKQGLELDLIATGSNPSIADVVIVTEVTTGFVATGDFHGSICLHDLRPDAGASSHHSTTWHTGGRYQH